MINPTLRTLASLLIVILLSAQEGHSNQIDSLEVSLQEAEEAKQNAEVAAERKTLVGSGDRSEKIRTYNIPQDRITDHRIKTNWSGVEQILGGAMQDIVTALQEEDIRLKLEAQSS